MVSIVKSPPKCLLRHHWGAWQKGRYRTVRQCLRCGNIQQRKGEK